jgi:signal transduction histidine kinase
VQEALTNVRKHAQASKVLVRLRYEDEALELVVLDNGRGVSNADQVVLDNGRGVSNANEERPGGFGLVGLRERMALLGGHVLYGPAEQGGYRVTARAPVTGEIAPQSPLPAANAI